MFGIGLPELILILALALIVVGPDKLPEMARSVAKGVLELKKTVNTLKESLEEENPFDTVKPELEDAARSIKEKLGDPAADAWRGVLPDGGVNPVAEATKELKDIIDIDSLSDPHDPAPRADSATPESPDNGDRTPEAHVGSADSPDSPQSLDSEAVGEKGGEQPAPDPDGEPPDSSSTGGRTA